MIDFGLLVPIAAVVALFGVIALAVRAFFIGRALRRIEERLAQGGGSAADASLERVRQLQTRAAVSTGTAPSARAITLGLMALVGLAIVAGGGWLLFGRGGDSPAGDPPAAQAGQNGDAGNDEDGDSEDPGDGEDAEPTLPDAEGDGDGAEPATPGGGDLANPPPLTDKGQYTVAVYNATNVQGAASNITLPRVLFFGYSEGPIGNSPDGRNDLERSVVMWPEGKRDVALNVASDLGIGLVSPLDGAFTEDQVGSADAIVFVGLDLAG